MLQGSTLIFHVQHCMNMPQEMLTTFNDNPDLLKKVVIDDESWEYGYDIQTKTQSYKLKHPEEPRPKKSCQVRSNVKVLLIIFFDCNGVVDHELLAVR